MNPVTDSSSPPIRLASLDVLRALALFAILLNHLVEAFGSGPWFTNPANNWPDFATRLRSFFPADDSFLLAAIRFLGWLGDSGPGVFILASGVALTYGALSRRAPAIDPWEFYRKRLLRIFPLYIAMHVVLLFIALLVPGNQLTLGDPRTLLSMLGMRFLPGLFFYLAPAWWFVGLILQLYLVFPLLFGMLQRAGVVRLLLYSAGFTFLCRLWGLVYSDHLYLWMTGSFFGTRLAEFTAGMAIGAMVYRGAIPQWWSGARRIALPAGAYAAGLLCSMTLPGSIVANLLVTLGLSGLFYAAAVFARDHLGRLHRGLLWVGSGSLAVFLLHQPLVNWSRMILGRDAVLSVMVAVIVLVLCFPAARAIERGVAALPRLLERASPGVLRWSFAATSVAVLATLIMLDGRLSRLLGDRALALGLGLLVGWLIYGEAWEGGRTRSTVERILLRTALTAGLVRVFFFLPGTAAELVLAWLVLACLLELLHTRVHRPWLEWVIGVGIFAGIAAVAEIGLRDTAPLEAGEWGERPALMLHPTRGYGLIPNRTTRLRYNRYDYVVRSNAAGLPGPEVTTLKASGGLRVLVLGDAFTMPEGMGRDSAYPALTQALLQKCLAPRPVELINAGITGYGPREIAAQLKELAPIYHPDMVVYQFFINEFSDITVSETDRREGIGLLADERPIGNRLWDHSQVVLRVLGFRRTLKERITGRPDQSRARRAFLHLYARGPSAWYADSTTGKIAAALAGMDQATRDAGGRMLVMFVPGSVAVSRPEQISYFPKGEDVRDTVRYDLSRPLHALERMAQPLGIPVLDLTAALIHHPEQPVYFPHSWHWNREGHRVAAAELAGAVESGCGVGG